MIKQTLVFLILVLSLLTLTFAAIRKPIANKDQIKFDKSFKTLENKYSVHIGLYAINTANHKKFAYHANKQFPVQSTMKVIGVAALLKQSEVKKQLLEKIVSYKKTQVVAWSPITKLYIDKGMSFEQLAKAAISFSDNTAINLIMNKLGGYKTITKFAQSLGNQSFNIKHDEPHLNSNPKVSDDTSTPKEMAMSLDSLLLKNKLNSKNQHKLIQWMRNNTTGYQRIRAGMPAGWVVADKTGTGSFGIANDLGMVFSPSHKPIIIAIYSYGQHHDDKPNDKVIADVTQLIMKQYIKQENRQLSFLHSNG